MGIYTDREQGEKEYVDNPEEYYPWRGISEEAILDFEGNASGDVIVDMTGEWYADDRIGINTKTNESYSAGYMTSLAWAYPTFVKFVRNGTVYEAKIHEIEIKPRDVRTYGFDCPAVGQNSAHTSALIQVVDVTPDGDYPVIEYGFGDTTLIHQNEIVAVKAEYIDGDRCEFNGEGIHTITIER